jgi:hypothetical protein
MEEEDLGAGQPPAPQFSRRLDATAADWIDFFDALLHDDDEKRLFDEYLQTEMVAENLAFYLAATKFRRRWTATDAQSDAQRLARLQDAQTIYNTFLDDSARYPVAMPQDRIKIVSARLGAEMLVTADLFDYCIRDNCLLMFGSLERFESSRPAGRDFFARGHRRWQELKATSFTE